jgi:hypothetical protein
MVAPNSKAVKGRVLEEIILLDTAPILMTRIKIAGIQRCANVLYTGSRPTVM